MVDMVWSIDAELEEIQADSKASISSGDEGNESSPGECLFEILRSYLS